MLNTPLDLRPGDHAFGPIGGHAGALVGAGQILVAPWKHRLTWKTWWRVRHCGIITEAGTVPTMAQAEPGGYEEIELTSGHWTADWTFIRPRYDSVEQAEKVGMFAQTMSRLKIPYAYEDYAAIAAHRVHVPVPHLDRFISAVGPAGIPVRAICSQGNDAALTLAGFPVFDDGRLSQDVVPAELYLRLLDLDPVAVVRPGKVWISRQAPRRAGSPAVSPTLL